MKRTIIAGLVAFALLATAGMVSATDVNIEYDGDEVTTHIEDGDVTYNSVVDPSKYVDLDHYVNIGNSFTVIDDWDGYFGSIDIETTFDSPSVHVEDNLYVAALSLEGQQVASSTYEQYEYGTNDLQLTRILEYDVGYVGITTEYESNAQYWDANSETSLDVYSASGFLGQDQIFTSNVGGVWEVDQWKTQRNMLLEVDGPYSMDYEINDLRGDDSGDLDYSFEFEASDGFLFWGGDAIFALDESYTSTEHGSGQWHREDGFSIDMYYQGDSNPDVELNAYGYNNLDTNVLTTVNGDVVTMQGTVEGE